MGYKPAMSTKILLLLLTLVAAALVVFGAVTIGVAQAITMLALVSMLVVFVFLVRVSML
ncbi:hypothetical protein REJC140_03996 [Pseudorhizobium endolithicum]|uniref:Uncharacterized protein n=2 Tax=Pseudorhizobium endolithicum TaxID=1191678 RepID=A0ABM8PSB2_9HYPH|nr:hypothetical protein REJC140_03996 [Pseudorhizobium endolithicum]